MSELDDGLRQMARKFLTEQRDPPDDGGSVVPVQAESALRRSLTMKSQYAVLVDDILERWRAEAAARPWHAKVRFRLIQWRNDWSWRLSKAWAHLRGIDCESDW